MLTALFIIAVSILPRSDVERDQCDLIELNHYYDDCGKHVFDQAIFYDWSEHDTRYQVRAWRLVKQPSQLPARDWGGARLPGLLARWRCNSVRLVAVNPRDVDAVRS
jgi:hypothetical protein